MKITLSPVRRDPIRASVKGDVLTINGGKIDLSQLQDGDILPGKAIATDLIDSDVTRSDGVIHITLTSPFGPGASDAARDFSVVDVSDGPVPFPAWSETEDAPNAVTKSGTIAVDWSKCERAAARAARELEEKRAGAAMERGQFAIALALAGVISKPEAEEWAAGNAIPSVAQGILAKMGEDDAFKARVELRNAPVIRRNAPIIAALSHAASLTDAQVDALFGL